MGRVSTEAFSLGNKSVLTAHEIMFYIIYHWVNENQNYKEIPLNSSKGDYHQKFKNIELLLRM